MNLKTQYDFTNLPNRNIDESLKWKLMYLQKADVEETVIPLSVADMEIKNAPEIIQGLQEFIDTAILGYTRSYDSYNDAVKSWMKRRHNYTIEKKWIINTPGVVNALYCAVEAFTKVNQGVIIMPPVYFPFERAINISGRKAVHCPLVLDEENRYSIDYELFEKLCKVEDNKLLLFCSPHNPVGRVWNLEELKLIGEIALRNDVIIISDEIWNDIIMPQYKHTVFSTISNEVASNCIICTAPTKTFNLAGLAISNIFIENAELRKKYLKTLKRIRSASINILGYKACEIAYTKSENWLEQLIYLIEMNQRLVINFLKENQPKIKANTVEGTYLQWLDFRNLIKDDKKRENFLINEACFFTTHGHRFGINGSGFERINLACPTEVLLKQLIRLSNTINLRL